MIRKFNLRYLPAKQGVALGVGATVFLRDILPAFKGVSRPLAKTAIRSSITGFDRARESLARFGENMEDLVAEVRSEMEEEAPQQAEGLASPESSDSEKKVNGGGNAS